MSAPIERVPVQRLTYSVDEVAQVLGVAEVTVRKMLDSGVLPELSRLSRRRLIPCRAVQQLLDDAMKDFDPSAARAALDDFEAAS